MVLFVIALVAIIGAAGLALDSGHTMLNKTRLQNTVDSAALSGAKTLDQTGDTVLATTDALAMFAGNASGQGNQEIAAAYGGGSLNVTVEFSSSLNPFVPGTSPPEYVRVRAQNFTMPAWFSQVLGVTQKTTAASAVAGPSPTLGEVCNVLPVMVCGDPVAGPPFWGYTAGDLDVLKSSAQGGSHDVGPGNFQLIRLGGSGGSVIRENMAGSYDACASIGDVIETEPGNSVGPVVQGLNTRFGNFTGPMNGMQSVYPPDVVTQQPNPPLTYDPDTDQIMQGGQPVADPNAIFSHSSYENSVSGSNYNHQPAPNGIGAFDRRVTAIPIGDCSVTTNGQGQVPLLGFGCYFMLQEAEQQGSESYVFGQFLSECNAAGTPGPLPTAFPGPYVIQLYRDYGSTDS
jgi:Flp pilus assembly protein TadG